MKSSRAWALAGLLLLLAARVAIPTAPAMYEGPILPTEPYHYCSPPANLARDNKQPSAGGGMLQASGGTNQLGSQATGDNQVLTFVPKGALQAPGATSYKVTLRPDCQPPAAPSRNRIVGNAYEYTVLGEPGDTPVKFVQSAQILIRTPPVRYTSVQIYYDGAWHSTQWGQQGDIANSAVDHSGTISALDDGSSNPPGKPPSQRAPGIVTIVEVILLAAAIGIVGAAIVVQRRRAAPATGSPARPPAGRGSSENRRRPRRPR